MDPTLVETNGFDFRNNIDAVFKKEVHALTIRMTSILSSPRCYHLNLDSGPDHAQRLVKQIVRLDRLPERTSLEGLLLLRDAWDDYDVTQLRAVRYKWFSKIFFFVQLVIGHLVICCATLGLVTNPAAGSDDPGVFMEVSFGLTLASSVLLVVEGTVKSKLRWRQLRSYAGSLERMIWLYRTRAGPFALPNSNPDSRQPEVEFCSSLNAWRDDLAAGAELDNSTLNRIHSMDTYRHNQHAESPPSEMIAGDDHHSPVKPADYIVTRIDPQMLFYQQRLPSYARRQYMLMGLLLTCTIATAVLSRYGLAPYVVTITSLAAAVTSWSEFADLRRKMERYNRAIRTLRKLLSFWMSLTEVEKASTEAISHLVMMGESAIADERLGWSSTGGKASGLPKVSATANEEDFDAVTPMDVGEGDGNTGKARARSTATVHPIMDGSRERA